MTAATAPTGAPRKPIPFAFALEEIKLEQSGAGSDQFTVTGHAAVFNKPSHDMGGFRFQIAPGAFTRALGGAPDIHLVLNHDMRWVLGRTRNGTLRLTQDATGLHMWARPAAVSYAADLRVLLERRDIDQMSFAGFIAADEWSGPDDDGLPLCTITAFADLVDATICAQGAFPQTDVGIAASYFEQSRAAGRVPGFAPVRAARGARHDDAAGVEGRTAGTTDDPSAGNTLRAERLAQVREAKAASRAALLKECK